MKKCKQHSYKFFLLSLVPNLIQQCEVCGETLIQVAEEGSELVWKEVTMMDLFGNKVYIITADFDTFEKSATYLSEDYHLPVETFLPLLTDVDMRGFDQICNEGGRPCVVLNPVNWFENPYLSEWNVASALSSNVGGILLRPLGEN